MAALKRIARYLDAKRKYPGVKAELGATLAGVNVFASDVSIAKDTYVYQCNFGKNTTVREGCRLFEIQTEGNNVIYEGCVISHAKIGAFTYISQQSQIGRLEIGRFCSVGSGFKTGFGSHPTNFVSTSPVFFSLREQCGVTFAQQDNFQEYETTKIGHDVWIGVDVYIRDGINVGHGAIVAAGSVVTKDIAPYSIVGGVPAKSIRMRFDDEVVEKLLSSEWWNWSEEKLRAAQSTFAKEGVEQFLQWHEQHK